MVDSAGGELHIEADSVLAAANEFRLIADELSEGFSRLVSSVDSVVETSWRGAAANMFGRDWDEFRGAAEKVVQDADEIATRVALSVNAYAAEDELGAAIVRRTWIDR